MKSEATEAAIAATAQKVTYGAGSAAIYGGLTANEFAAIGGLIVAILGLIVQLYYKHKQDRREQRFHEERMARLDDGDYGADGL